MSGGLRTIRATRIVRATGSCANFCNLHFHYQALVKPLGHSALLGVVGRKRLLGLVKTRLLVYHGSCGNYHIICLQLSAIPYVGTSTSHRRHMRSVEIFFAAVSLTLFVAVHGVNPQCSAPNRTHLYPRAPHHKQQWSAPILSAAELKTFGFRQLSCPLLLRLMLECLKLPRPRF
jgi:hypothetical protein